MVEHLLAALRIAGVSDADIELTGDEVPVLDGSSADWLDALKRSGLRKLDIAVECFLVAKNTSFEFGASRYEAMPGQFSLDCTIDFPNVHIGKQTIRVDEMTMSSLASARTFVLEGEIAILKSHNLALGGSLDNAVVIGDDGPLNEGGFRMEYECAHHKALDFIGDLMVVGIPVIGRFDVFAPGHSANNAFVEHLLTEGILRRVSIVGGNLNSVVFA
jgi:UDP-3-O-[3-hydroxymyristoyl] N-acetylglucosamine deacetylase